MSDIIYTVKRKRGRPRKSVLPPVPEFDIKTMKPGDQLRIPMTGMNEVISQINSISENDRSFFNIDFDDKDAVVCRSKFANWDGSRNFPRKPWSSLPNYDLTLGQIEELDSTNSIRHRPNYSILENARELRNLTNKFDETMADFRNLVKAEINKQEDTASMLHLFKGSFFEFSIHFCSFVRNRIRNPKYGKRKE